MKTKIGIAMLVAVVTACTTSDEISSDEYESHSWGSYHWAMEVNPFTLPTVNSMTPAWDGHLNKATIDWSNSEKLSLALRSGNSGIKIRRRCPAPQGKIRVCNLSYGQTGWLGVAGIYIDSNGHIVKGYTKLNDSYFSLSFYDNYEWKQSVICQELGHNLGLGHQDEDFSNVSLQSCMDYQNPPWPEPNVHDFEQLTLIYNHLDSYSTIGESEDDGGVCNAPPGKGCNSTDYGNSKEDWGTSLGNFGGKEIFIQDVDDLTEITVVLWAQDILEL